MREIDPRDCQHGQADTEQETKECTNYAALVEPVCFAHQGEIDYVKAGGHTGAFYLENPDSDPEFVALYSAATVARLIAERDAACNELELIQQALGNAMSIVADRDALQDQVKTLRAALEKIADWDASWGPYPENNEAWRAMVVVTAREAVPRALAATEPKKGEKE